MRTTLEQEELEKCIASQFVDCIILFPFKLKSLHLSNSRYILTEMSLVERNELQLL